MSAQRVWTVGDNGSRVNRVYERQVILAADLGLHDDVCYDVAICEVMGLPEVDRSGMRELLAARPELYSKAWANAQLLAAAPQLLAALEDMVPIAQLIADEGCDHSVGICVCGVRRSIDVARETIAQAKGEEYNSHS